jgi:glycine cleavage system aminomethyltransferase T
VKAPVRRSPFAAAQTGLGAILEPRAGWEVAASYGDEAEERTYLRESVAIVDITSRGKVDVRGRLDGALAAAGEALVARIARDWALVLGEPGDEAVLLPRLTAAAGSEAMVTDATHLFGGFALVGPRLPDLLARLTSWDPASLGPGGATGAPIADVRTVVVRRALELPVLEVYIATELSRYAWETVVGVVRSLGGGPAGWAALRAEGWR